MREEKRDREGYQLRKEGGGREGGLPVKEGKEGGTSEGRKGGRKGGWEVGKQLSF